ncbi:MAG: TolC family protein, partial [Deltaproteobacteria bacterium]|nr:TolC family protein [Deltaproteobacteria bacterium]
MTGPLKPDFKLAGLVLAAFLVLAAKPALGQTLNLQTCLDLALEKSLSVRQAEAGVEAAEFEVKEAQTSFYPQLSTTYGYTRLDEATKVSTGSSTYIEGSANHFQWKVSLSQPLFYGYALVTNKKLKDLGLMSQRLQVELARLDLALEVKQAYFEVLLAQKQQGVAQQAVKQLEAQVEVAKNFYQVGMIPKNDLLQVEVELANARQTLIKAGNSVRLAKAQLNTLLRREVESAVDLEDVEEFAPAEPGFGPSLQTALETRPEVKQADLAVESAQQGVKL